MRNVFENKNIGEMVSLVRNAFGMSRHANNAGLILSIFMFRPMFKQHANFLIRTRIFVHLTMGVNSYTNRYLGKNIILSLCTQRCYGRHSVSCKSVNHYSCIDVYLYIGITHVFSCINICRASRMLFEHKANRLSDQTFLEGPGKC